MGKLHLIQKDGYRLQSYVPLTKVSVQNRSQEDPIFDGVNVRNRVKFWDRIIGIAAISYHFFDVLDKNLVK
jgi:hypothetical protein